MSVETTSDEKIGRDGWVTRSIDWIFGYDFFLSYSHGDGLNLPRHIKDRLTRAGFHVFLDQTEYVAGIDLRRETRRQVRKSRKFVVIGRPLALKSQWVRREVDVALAHGKTPVVYNVNTAVETAPPGALLATMVRENHWLRLNETLADPDGEPTASAIAELVRGFGHTRQETKRQRILTAAAAILAIAAGVAIWQAVEATRARLVAEAQRDRAERVLDQVVATANRRVQSLSNRITKRRVVEAAASAAVETAVLDTSTGTPLERAARSISLGEEALKAGDADKASAAFKDAFDVLGTSQSHSDARAAKLTRLKALDRLADTAEKLRDPRSGLSLLTQAAVLAEQYASADPEAAIWRQANASIRQRLAAFALKTNDDAGAEAHLQAALAEWTALAKDDAVKALAQRELAITLSRLGDISLARAEPDASLAFYYQSLEILKPLSAADVTAIDPQSDLSAVYQRIADAQLKAARPEKAMKWIEADVAVAHFIAGAHPDEPLRQRDLASSYDRKARALELLGRDADALKAYREGSHLFQLAILKVPSEASWQRDAASILESKGKLLGRTGEPDDAIRDFRDALVIREGLAAAYEEPSWQREVEAAYRRASEIMLVLGRTEEALETAEQYLLSTSLMSDTDGSRAERIGRALGTLCWSAVNARNFARAEWAGKEAVVLAPSLDWARLNYAHALMLSGHRDKAKVLYLAGLDLPAKDAKAWRDSIIKDFGSLRMRKLGDPLMAEVLAKIGS